MRGVFRVQPRNPPKMMTRSALESYVPRTIHRRSGLCPGAFRDHVSLVNSYDHVSFVSPCGLSTKPPKTTVLSDSVSYAIAAESPVLGSARVPINIQMSPS